MKLYEGGILDKITNDEYEKMYQSIPRVGEVESQEDDSESKAESTTKTESKKVSAGVRDDHTTLNLRMLQGSFYLVLFGHSLAFLILLGEIECHSAPLHVAIRSKRIFNTLRSGTISSFRRILQWIEMLKSF